MIKFKCLIHKKSDLAIKYEDWLKLGNDKNRFTFTKINSVIDGIEDVKSVFEGTKLDMLVSDEFEVVYDNQFTERELFNINSIASSAHNFELCDKVRKIINESEELKFKYGIDY